MRHTLVALCGSALLVACGSTIQSKQDAANAVHALTLAGNSAKTSTGNGINVNTTITGQTGTADVTISTDSGFTMTLNFHHYSADGKNTFDGTMNYAFAANVGSNSLDVGWTLNGSVTMTGDYNDSVTVNNLTETLSATAFGQGSGQISVNMSGSVIADGHTYLFNNESVTVNVSP